MKKYYESGFTQNNYSQITNKDINLNNLSIRNSNNTQKNFDSQKISLLILQNVLLKNKNVQLYKEIAFLHLKFNLFFDSISSNQIGPLTRNSQPNQSVINIKSTAENFTKLTNSFQVKAKNTSNQELVKLYKQKITQIQKIVYNLKAQKQNIQTRERQLIEKLKGLRFKSVGVQDIGMQTTVNLEDLTKRQLQIKKSQHNLKQQLQQRTIALQYRENYLDYIDQAIKKKQLQILNRQQQLHSLQAKLKDEDLRYKIQPLSHLVDSKSLYEYFVLLKDRIYQAVNKYQQGNEQGLKLLQNHPLYDLFENYQEHNVNSKAKMYILKLLEINILEIRYKLQIAEEQFKNQYERTIQLKHHLEEKNTKFIELNSYENYLNKYKELIDRKQTELKNQRQLFSKQVKLIIEYLSIQQNQQDSISSKILTATSNDNSTIMILKHIQKDPRNSSSKNRIFNMKKQASSILSEYKNQKNQTNSFELEKQYISEKINNMKEEYNKKYQNTLLVNQKVSKLEIENRQLKKQLIESKQLTFMQPTQNNKLDQILTISKNKRLIIKYLTKWFELDFNKNIKNNNISKKFAFNIWRIRQYDPEIFNKIIDLTSENYEPYIQKIWNLKCQKDKKDKLFPYKSLSLKRKQFLEEFFDYQRKQFFKNKLKSMLLSILRNKVRKQRVVVVVAFHKFIRNCSVQLTKIQNHETLQKKYPILKSIKQNQVIKKSRQSSIYQSNKKSFSKKTITNENQLIQKVKELEQREIMFKGSMQNQRIQLQLRLRKMLGCMKLVNLKMDEQKELCKRKFKAFYHWTKSINSKQTQKMKKFQQKIQQFQFKMGVFNTKYKLLQGSFSSKIQLMEELLSVVISK